MKNMLIPNTILYLIIVSLSQALAGEGKLKNDGFGQSYLERRRAVFRTKDTESYKKLFPASYHDAINSNKKIVRKFLKNGLFEVVGFGEFKKVSLAESGLGHNVSKMLKPYKDYTLYKVHLKLAGNGRAEVILIEIANNIYQLHNF